MELKGMERFGLSNKTAVITGGCGHLGRGMACALGGAGAEVVVCDLSREIFDERFREADRGRIAFREVDVSATESIAAGFREIAAGHGGIDVLVNNAIYSSGQSPESMSDADWGRGIDGVLNSVYRCIREALPHMKERGGAIVNIASMYGMVSPDFRVYEGREKFLNPPHYGAAKAGVIQMTRYFAVCLARYKIRVNCISPGPFPSPAVQEDAEFIRRLSAKTPAGRIGRPEELEGPLLFLASEASSYVNGHNLVVDGGWTAW